MALFMSSVTNKVDKKGRVSVPALFRAELANEPFNGVIVFPSIQRDSIEGAGRDFMQQLSHAIDELPPFSAEREQLEKSILGGAQPLNFDSEGRILIPADLLLVAGISDRATFVGVGKTFQIWHPETYDVRQEEANKWTKENPNSIPWGGRRSGDD